MEVSFSLLEVLDRVRTKIRGYDLERLVRAVVRNLSSVQNVVAIFVCNDDRPLVARFIVVMQTRRNDWDDSIATSDTMNLRMTHLKRRFRPLQVGFDWELWGKWRRQDNFAGATRVWLRPR